MFAKIPKNGTLCMKGLINNGTKIVSQFHGIQQQNSFSLIRIFVWEYRKMKLSTTQKRNSNYLNACIGVIFTRDSQNLRGQFV